MPQVRTEKPERLNAFDLQVDAADRFDRLARQFPDVTSIDATLGVLTLSWNATQMGLHTSDSRLSLSVAASWESRPSQATIR